MKKAVRNIEYIVYRKLCAFMPVCLSFTLCTFIYSAPSEISTSFNSITYNSTTTAGDYCAAFGRSPQRVLFQTNDEKYFIIIYDKGKNVVYKVSSDNGLSWGSENTIISTSSYLTAGASESSDYSLSGFIDTSNNDIYLAFIGDTSVNNYAVRFVKLTYSGSGMWSVGTIYTASSNSAFKDFVGIVRQSSGRIWISYFSESGTVGAKAVYSDDNGVNWSTEYELGNGDGLGAGRNSCAPVITLYQDKPLVIYAVYGNLKYRYWDGNAWVPALGSAGYDIPNDGSLNFSLDTWQGRISTLTTNSGVETLHMVYFYNNNTSTDARICYQRLSGNFTNWTGWTTLASSGSNNKIHTHPKLTTDGTNLYCFWLRYDTTKTDYDIVYSKSTDNGATWSSPTVFYTSNNPTLFNKVFVYYDGTSNYEDKTTAAAEDTSADVFHSTSGRLVLYVNDAIYFGNPTTFNNIFSDFSTLSSYTGGQIVWEYSKGGGVWQSFTPNDPVGYQQYVSRFRMRGRLRLWKNTTDNPIPSDWVTDTVNSVSNYWVRARLSNTGYVVLNNAGSYETRTTEAGNATSADVKHSVTSGLVSVVGDEVYIGGDNTFTAFETILSTAGVPGTATINWTYWNGSSWNAVSGMNPAGYKFDTTAETLQKVTFSSPTGWAKTSVNGINAYWIKGTVATANFTTPPIGTKLGIGASPVGSKFQVFKINPIYPSLPSKTTRVIPCVWAEDTPNSQAGASYNCPLYSLKSDRLIIAPSPVVDDIQPNNGLNTGITTVTVIGNYFYGGGNSGDVSKVELDDPQGTNISTYSVISDTVLIANIPAGIKAGTYNIKVTTTGGTNDASTTKYVVQTIAPTVLDVTPTNGYNSESVTITIKGTGFYGGTSSIIDVLSVKLDNNGPTLSGWTVLSDTEIRNAIIPAQTKAGTYNVLVTNSGGSNLTSSVKFEVKTNPPVVLTVSPSSGSNLALETISIIGNNFYGGTTSSDVISIKLSEGTSLSGYSVLSDTEVINIVIPTGIKAGTYDVLVTTSGGTNSTSAQKYEVTSDKPIVSNVQPNSGGNTGDVTINITGDNFYGGTTSADVLQVRLSSGLVLSGWSCTSDTSVINAVVPAGVSSGTFDVIVRTSAGENTTSAVKYVVLPGPVVTTISPNTGSNLSPRTVSITGSGFSVGITSIRLSDPQNTQFSSYSTVDDTMIINAVIPSGVLSGTYDVKVTTSVGTNNTSAQKYVVTTNPPVVNNINPSSGGNTGKVTISITGSGFYGGTSSIPNVSRIRLSDASNTEFLSYSVISDTSIINAVIPIGVAVGTYDVRVLTGGGENSTSAVKYIVNSGPIVSLISPDTGSNSTTTTVSIMGSGFLTLTNIKLNDIFETQITSYSIVNDTSIINAIIPSKIQAGTYDIKVTNSNGTNDTSEMKFKVTTLPPIISNVTPNIGTNNNPITLSITGLRFYGGTDNIVDIKSLKLDDIANTSITGYSVISDSQITNAIIPAGVKAGTYNVIATNGGGSNTTSGNKIIISTLEPVVTSISPNNGSNLGTNTITIIGSNFYGGTTGSDVKEIKLTDINNTQITSYSVISDSQITNAIVPAGIKAGTYDIRVTTGGGTNLTSGDKYIVTTVFPSITSVSPDWGGNTAPVTVTISGTGFLGGTVSGDIRKIRLTDAGSTEATGWVVISDTLVRSVIIPPGISVGTYDVKVTTGGGETTNEVKFIVKQGPKVSSIVPSSGKNTGVTLMDILGEGYYGGTGSNNVSLIKLTDPFNTALTGYSVVSDVYITSAKVAAGLVPGTYDVKITTGIGTNITSDLKFVVLPGDKPTVTNVLPPVVYNNGKSAVTILGTGFYGGSAVANVTGITLDDSSYTSLTDYSVLSDTLILNAKVPAGVVPGMYNVRVSTIGGANETSTIKLNVIYPPVLVTNINPSSGLNTGNTLVEISGSGFYGGGSSSGIISIKLDDLANTEITNYEVGDDTLIVNAIIPSNINSGRYNVQVSTKTGSNTTSLVKFDVLIDKSINNIVQTKEGVELDIPAGTFDKNTAVIVTSNLSNPNLVEVADKMKYKNLKVTKELKNIVREIFTSNGAVVTSGKAITIKMGYSNINDPVIEKDLKIAWLNSDNKWEILSGEQSIDMSNKIITAVTSHLSYFRIVQYVTQANDLNNVVVYPNPVDFSNSAKGTVKFKNLTYNPTIFIYTISGEEVIRLEPDKVYNGNTINDGISGIVEWDGSNINGSKVARGLYIYVIKDEEGNRKVGKIAVK
jgi:hypothetical protein